MNPIHIVRGNVIDTLAETLLAGNVTDGTDISLSLTDKIISGVTNNELLLNDGFGGWHIDSNNGTYTGGYIYGSLTSIYAAVGTDAELIGTTSRMRMRVNAAASGMVGKPQVYLSSKEIGIADTILVTTGNLWIQDISTTGGSSQSVDNVAVFINSGANGAGLESTAAIGLDRVVALGGQDISMKTNDTAYTNQISLQPAGNLFDGLLVPPALTADRTWTFPNNTGTVALTSDILGTNLSIGTKTATTVDVNSSTGTNVTLPAVTITEAGLMTAADKVKLDGIEAGAQVNNHLGSFAADPIVPVSGGETYYNTTLNTMMYNDLSRSKWLSMSSLTYGFSRNGNTAAGSYFNMAGGILMTPTVVGYPTFADATLIGIQITRTDVDEVTIEVAADGVAVGEITLGAGITSGTVTLNADITNPAILTARVKSGTNTVSDCAGAFAIKIRA